MKKSLFAIVLSLLTFSISQAYWVGGINVDLNHPNSVLQNSQQQDSKFQITSLGTFIFQGANRFVYLKADGSSSTESYCFILRRQTGEREVLNTGRVLSSFKTELFSLTKSASDDADYHEQIGVYVRFRLPHVQFSEVGCFVKDAQTLDADTVNQAIDILKPFLNVTPLN